MFKSFLTNVKIILISILFILNISNAQAKHHECDIVIKNKDFQSGKLTRQSTKQCIFTLKSGVKQKVRICNQDKLPMEFESHDLRREKIIKPNKSALISLPILRKGKKYNFFEEFYGNKCIFEAV
jgi:hypothetical protein